MSEAPAVGSLPWIPKQEAREKYEASGDKTAFGGDVVSGPIVEVSQRENFNKDGMYDVVVLDVKDVGRVAIHCQPQVLASQMKRARGLAYGDVITVSYLGEVRGNNDRTYSNYEVAVPTQIGAPIRWADSPAVETFVPPGDPAAYAQHAHAVPVASGQQADDDIPF